MTVSAPVGSPLGDNLLDVEGLSGVELERICDLAVEMREARAERRARGPNAELRL